MEVYNHDIIYYSDNLDLLQVIFSKNSIISLNFNTLIISGKKLVYSSQLTSWLRTKIGTVVYFICRKMRDFGVVPIVIHFAVQSLPWDPELVA